MRGLASPNATSVLWSNVVGSVREEEEEPGANVDDVPPPLLGGTAPPKIDSIVFSFFAIEQISCDHVPCCLCAGAIRPSSVHLAMT